MAVERPVVATEEALAPGVRAAVERGLAFLCRAQEPNGCFVDFALPPGASDGWVTAFVTVGIDEATRIVPSSSGRESVGRAAEALIRDCRPGGWGYNARAATDGDSTAFAVRAILRAGCSLPAPPEALLAPYLDEKGLGHTFLDAGRMGSWAGGHPEVTASLGMALYEAAAAAALRERVVGACLAARGPDGLWATYWWRRPYFAAWLNLELLQAASALAADVALASRAGLLRLEGDISVLDLGSVLSALLLVEGASGEPVPGSIVRRLLSLQRGDGGWPPSWSLLVPPQHPTPSGMPAAHQVPTPPEPRCYSDSRGLFTSAVVVQSLASCLLSPCGLGIRF